MWNVSIVIPVFNESLRIAASAAKLRAWILELNRSDIEVLFVVEKSSDNSLQQLQRATHGLANVQVIDNHVQRGKGFAVKSGVLRARGNFIFFCDFDFSTPLSEVLRFEKLFREQPGAHALIGDRKSALSQIGVAQPLWRQIASRVFHSISASLFGLPYRDTQCGFKAFRREAIPFLFEPLKTEGFAFDIEVLMRAKRTGLHVMSVPVIWNDEARSSVRLVRDSMRMVRELILIRSELRAEGPAVAFVSTPRYDREAA